MKKLLILILLYILTGSFASTFAQVRGYILRKDSTYADGYITNNQNYGSQVLFRPSLQAEDVAYEPAQLLEFGFAGVTYITKKVLYNTKQEEVFLQLLESGNLSLYMLHTAVRKLFYLEHQGQLTALTEANLADVYSPYLAYCQSLKRQSNSMSVQQKDLEKLTRQINNKSCSPLFTVTVGAVAKPVHAAADIDKDFYSYEGQVPALETNWIDAGMFVELPYLLVSNLNLQGEMLYRRRKFESTGTQPEGNDISITQSALQLNLMPRYTISSGKIRPFVEAGGVMVVDINSTSSLTRRYYHERPTGQRVLMNFKDDDFFSLSGLAFGYMGAAGVKYMFRNNYNYLSFGVHASIVQHEHIQFEELGLTVKVNL